MGERPFSSVKTESSSDWSPRRSHGKMEVASAISWTGAILGRRMPVPFTVGGTSLPPEMLGGLVFWRSIATVPVSKHIHSKQSPDTCSSPGGCSGFSGISFTHAGNDAVHGQLWGPIVHPPCRASLPLLLVEDEGGVLLLGDVDIVTGVCGGHDVMRSRIEQNAFVLLPLYSDETNTVSANYNWNLIIMWA